MKHTKRILAIAMVFCMVLAFAVPALASGEASASAEVSASAAASGGYTEEETADGWIKVTQNGGPTLGYSPNSGVTLLEVDGFVFKDLDKDGELDVYEDWREDALTRAEDLAYRLSVEQMGGLRYLAKDPGVSADGYQADMDKFVRSLYGNSFQSSDVKLGVKALNEIQERAETAELGVPVVPNMDPPMAYFGMSSQLSQAATFNPEMVQEVYAKGAQLMRAYGFYEMLGPQADMATEPRWSRISGTFGEDPALVRDLVDAAVTGLQSTFDENGNDLGWGVDSVIAEVKHYPGDGPAEGGRESHNPYGKYSVYPGEAFETSLIPFFDGAFNLDSATEYAGAVMPSYSIAWSENGEYGDLVGSNFSAYKIDLLRENGYEGLISTDSLIMPDNVANVPTVSVHGMEGMSSQEVIYQILYIGIDRILMPDFGEDPSLIDQIINVYDMMVEEEGEEFAEENFRSSAIRILHQFMKTGVFENPYSDTEYAKAMINDSGVTNGFNEVNQKSIVMVKNSGDVICERSEKPTVYIPLKNGSAPISLETASEYFNVVTDTTDGSASGEASSGSGEASGSVTRASTEELADCDFAVVFISAPSSGSSYDSATDTYYPISLQYGEYTADGDNVREESLSQGEIRTEVETPYGPTFSVSIDDRSYYGESTVASNRSQLDYLQDVADSLPDTCKLIACVSTSNPMIFSEFEEACDAILVSFGVSSLNFLPILAGQVEPYGLLPLQMPADMDTVEGQFEDVPRDMECHVDSDGNAYDFAFGMNWSGVINDERVATYKVEPLSTVETIEFHLAD